MTNTDENGLPIVSQMTEIIAYQPGAVVSHTLIDKPTGTFTLFAFDKNQGLSEHTAPYDALVHVLEGKALITISGKDYFLSAGDMIIMPANKPHALKAIEKYKMLLGMVRS